MKSDNNNSWIKQDTNLWMKTYPKKIRAYILLNLTTMIYEISIQDKHGREIAYPEIAKTLTHAKRRADEIVKGLK